MPRKCGRPSKTAEPIDARRKIINATIALIMREGADAVTVRSVVEETGLSIGTFYHHFKNKDDLMMYFVREDSFDGFTLETPLEHFSDRISELYFYLIDRYLNLGEEFMKSFYTTGNQALSAYMGEENGCFADGTVMARCQREAEAAIAAGILKEETDAHVLSIDVCTIVKGCVFEWALKGGDMDIHQSVRRILERYILSYVK
ncbi:MAG: TetR/AcrR family transcriptional regulator [Clostridia bacterium]|nr:TetR/AcrR family transcriptional regulator [Clostridia bacterium]